MLGQAQVVMFQIPPPKLLLFNKYASSFEGSSEPLKVLLKEKKYMVTAFIDIGLGLL